MIRPPRVPPLLSQRWLLRVPAVVSKPWRSDSALPGLNPRGPGGRLGVCGWSTGSGGLQAAPRTGPVQSARGSRVPTQGAGRPLPCVPPLGFPPHARASLAFSHYSPARNGQTFRHRLAAQIVSVHSRLPGAKPREEKQR